MYQTLIMTEVPLYKVIKWEYIKESIYIWYWMPG